MIGVGTYKVTDKAFKYVNEVLRAERLSYGPFTKKFENIFAASHDCRFAVMTNSGTSSLLISLSALKNKYLWNDGDEVIVPAITFIATSNIVIQNNMKPVFVDVDPIYYELDPSHIEKAITPRTKCIIPVHLFGCPCDMNPIIEIAKKYNLKILEDSCETMFARYNGKSVGSFGDIGCFSTYVAHILVTGVGGLCTTNDPELAIYLRSAMNHGRDSIYISMDDDQDKSKQELNLIIKKRFSFVQLGHSFRVTELEGALGLAEFENYEAMLIERKKNAQFFIENLKSFEKWIQLPSIRIHTDHSFMMFPIVLKDSKKDELVNYLENSGIETRDMLPITNQPIYKNLLLGINENDYPIAKWINNNGFYIGCHHGLSNIEMEFIVNTFHKFFNNKKIKKEQSCLILTSKVNKKVDELTLQNVLANIPIESFDELILIDASSFDDISSFFSKQKFKVIHEDKEKGDMIKKAIELCTTENIVVMGLEGADDISTINQMLIKLQLGNELVIASRFTLGGGRNTERVFSYRSFGNRFFTFLISLVFNKNITDCNNNFRGFKKASIEKLNLKTSGSSIMFEMTIAALNSNLRYDECPTFEKIEIIYRDKTNRFFAALKFLIIILRYALRGK